MISEANQKAIEAAGLSFILGMWIPHVRYVAAQWRREHPGEEIPDGQVLTQPWPARPTEDHRRLAAVSELTPMVDTARPGSHGTFEGVPPQSR
jgi:hypothetical protein